MQIPTGFRHSLHQDQGHPWHASPLVLSVGVVGRQSYSIAKVVISYGEVSSSISSVVALAPDEIFSSGLHGLQIVPWKPT